MIIKSITAMGSKGHHRFTLSVQEDSTSVSDNLSLISFTFKISATSSSWQWRGYPGITYSVSINGTSYTGSIASFNGSTTTLKSGSNIEIPHESDGTKTINIGFSVSDPNTSVSYTCGNASESSIMQLTDLHTPPEISNVTVAEYNSDISSLGEKIVKYLSIKRFTISAYTYDGATISKYRIYNGTELLEERTSSQLAPNVFDIYFAAVELQTLKVDANTYYAKISFEVEDNLGGITRYAPYSRFEAVDYQKPNIITTSSNVQRIGQSTGEVKLNLNATFKSGTIGSKTNSRNTMTMQFAYWQKGQAESSTYYPIDITSSNPNVSVSGDNLTITDWQMKENGNNLLIGTGAYYFKIKFTDAFNKNGTSTLLCNSSEYLMCKFPDRVDFKKITQKNIPVLTEGVIAFEDSAGDNGDLTLNYDSADYNHCIIFFRTNDNDTPVNSVIIDEPNGKTVMLMGIQPFGGNDTVYFKSKKISISGTLITNVNYSEVSLKSSTYPSVSTVNQIYITKVIFF